MKLDKTACSGALRTSCVPNERPKPFHCGLSASFTHDTVKRGYKGTYHQMSAKHLSRYVTEFTGRHNVRGLDTIVQMTILVQGIDGKRLRYDDLVEAS